MRAIRCCACVALLVLLHACGGGGGYDGGPVGPPSPPPPAQQVFTRVSGDGQSGNVGAQLANPLVVRLATSADSPVAGAEITFVVTSGTGTLQAATVTTDVAGRAEVRLTLGRELGTVVVRARTPANAEVTFTATPQVTFSTIYAGAAHTCASASFAGGGLYCWGANAGGQLGDGSTTSRQYPKPVPFINGSLAFTQVSLGLAHSCALIAAGEPYCWGTNTTGQLGDATLTQRTSPNLVAYPGALRFSTIDVGREHSCATVLGGGVYCWGSNTSSQLGATAATPRTTPIATTGGGAQLNTVAAGDAHSCGRSNSNALFCWGEMIPGTGSSAPAEVVMPNGGTVVRVDAGGKHSCVNTATPTALYCWGMNDRGQLGIGSTTNQTQPAVVTLPSGTVFEIRLGDKHSCVRTSTAAVYCWGANDRGQLGNGNTTDRMTPTLVPLPAGVEPFSLAAGASHTCVTSSNGTYCWGANASGQLGDDTTADRLLPVRVRTQ